MPEDTTSHPVDPVALMRLTDEVKSHLRFLSALGCTGAPARQETLDILRQWEDRNRAPAETIGAITRDIAGCRRCRLAGEGTPAVIGAGAHDARLMFVGGFPDASDRKAGSPYTGAAGELLSKIISAIHLSRESVYICHVVKCRPENDIPPDRFVARACRTFLDRQIDVIRPDVICTLGEYAARVLLRSDQDIAGLRGRFHEYRGIRLMPTYDPAFLLKNPAAKRAVWEDMKQIMQVCGLAET